LIAESAIEVKAEVKAKEDPTRKIRYKNEVKIGEASF